MTTVNEGSTCYLDVSFKDKDGVLAAPTSISYRIDCITSDQEIKDDTDFGAPAASIEIEIDSADNAIIDQANNSERRLVTVTGTYGAEDKIVEEYEYDVMNMTKKP
ncbi:hypothetical protein KAR91_65285 [Candidatus Pacearchaeota archaeon]|nr:hypothetical protein [Candidatus Pacearchaeota archaeon]